MLERVLTPRSKGMSATLVALRGCVDSVLDVTLGYVGGDPQVNPRPFSRFFLSFSRLGGHAFLLLGQHPQRSIPGFWMNCLLQSPVEISGPCIRSAWPKPE